MFLLERFSPMGCSMFRYVGEDIGCSGNLTNVAILIADTVTVI